MISIVVPAHNESLVIERCLRRLVEGAELGELEVIVVCNGCSDDTAERARGFQGPVRVIETPLASKPAALNLGDEAARGYPRFFVDADVVLPLASVREVATLLRGGEIQAASPTAVVDLGGASWAVRAFYRVWTRLPYFDETMIGSGVCALSEQGRARFDRFPDIIADDEFLRRNFAPTERRRIASCSFTIVPPSRLSGVIDIKTRSRLGLMQLERIFPDLSSNDPKTGGNAIRVLLRQPDLWPSAPIYVFVAIATRLRAARRLAAGEFGLWDRDDSSRARDVA